jgi:trimeric autotransporter adhesin
MTVCWQVTGVRQDVYAQAHPLLVEEDKPSRERGYYLHPELYEQPADRSIGWARFPEQMRLISERAQAAQAQADSEEDQADVQPTGRK